ncbi:hypothetical protein BDN72DRAFT_754178 [Pluteus cervinus]|uniref:Uncharacterized protein n=1 Tax=Pluteus cervinus TaxID=181527 RepID=A0ACD3BFR6_9AGAR|nr:hypothetical protein BDN72DRAFT_754178 [Pluteus cervinus]
MATISTTTTTTTTTVVDGDATGSSSSTTPIELIFLGTGTSSSLPHVECLTAPPEAKPCRACLSTLSQTPEGKKNVRRNTGAALRMKAKDGRMVTIVIDAGKNFQAAALEWFPKYGLRRIDALLITHPHADAMNGLDDLRGWTLNEAIQSHIDVYVSPTTFVEVQRSFPYLVSKEFASGGGDVPQFKWHMINDKVPFEILDTGITVTPFSVHHGRVFSTVPPPGFMPTPSATTPSTPTKSADPLPKTRPGSPENPSVAVTKAEPAAPATEVIHPYLCFGFKFGSQLVYISDASHIPDDVWPIITSTASSPLPVLVLDCLRLRPHTSHFGLHTSIETSRRIDAKRTYWTGFSHDVAHDEYVTITEVVGGAQKDDEKLTEAEKAGLELIGQGKNIWVRPAHDGLRVFIDGTGVRDESY